MVVIFCAKVNMTVVPADMLPELPHRQLLCKKKKKKNARGTSDHFFENPLCHYSLMILKPAPTRISDWHSIMISREKQLFHIIRLSMNSIQVLPFQLFYECAREMAVCQRQHPHDCLKQHPDIKRKKESLTNCNVSNFGCFAHPLQLCIHDAIFNQKSVQEFCTGRWKFGGRFKDQAAVGAKILSRVNSACLIINWK